MTKLLYLSDSYLKEFEANVLEVSEQGHVRLDCTAFYPGGGGQPFDLGTIQYSDNKCAVIRIARQNELIWHIFDGEYTPSVGQTVKGIIDWELRYKLMRTHTACLLYTSPSPRDRG